jgi:hypothetical protein
MLQARRCALRASQIHSYTGNSSTSPYTRWHAIFAGTEYMHTYLNAHQAPYMWAYVHTYIEELGDIYIRNKHVQNNYVHMHTHTHTHIHSIHSCSSCMHIRAYMQCIIHTYIYYIYTLIHTCINAKRLWTIMHVCIYGHVYYICTYIYVYVSRLWELSSATLDEMQHQFRRDATSI